MSVLCYRRGSAELLGARARSVEETAENLVLYEVGGNIGKIRKFVVAFYCSLSADCKMDVLCYSAVCLSEDTHFCAVTQKVLQLSN